MLTKRDIRKAYLERRLNLPEQDMQQLNAQLLQHCRQLDYSAYRLAHVFLPITEKREADTYALVSWLRQTQPSLQWALPRANLDTGEMQHFLWQPHTVLVKNRYGIPEPAGGTEVMPAEIDLVFVPLLAFDLRGQRVGYGKGMYDRFLQQCRPGVATIGLSLFEPVEMIADADSRDVPLQTVITPHTIYEFKKN